MTKVSDFLENDLVFKEKPTAYNFEDIEGQKFGKLTVMGFVGKDKHRNALWHCECECGNRKTVQANNLKNSHTKSCGCHNIQKIKERQTTHGHATSGRCSRIYSIWMAMMRRCYNPNIKNYHRYGGRGIIVCESWHKFENFLADMGEPILGMSIDRMDNNGNYCPENCKWATPKEQANNRRSNRILEFNGRLQTMAQWANETGVRWSTIYNRLKKGWSIERALTA